MNQTLFLIYIPIPIEMGVKDIHSTPKTMRSIIAVPKASAPSTHRRTKDTKSLESALPIIHCSSQGCKQGQYKEHLHP